MSFTKTHPVCNRIGVRKAPCPSGRAGYVRIDSVHIPKKHAQPINIFYQKYSNPWLNLHRPCMFAASKVRAKGKVVKVYKHADVKTALEAHRASCKNTRAAKD